MAFDFSSDLTTLMQLYGEAVTLVGDGWRYSQTASGADVLCVIQEPWVGANANGLPINRTESMGTVYTVDVSNSGIAVGDSIETATATYRILGMMADDYGATELMLKEEA